MKTLILAFALLLTKPCFAETIQIQSTQKLEKINPRMVTFFSHYTVANIEETYFSIITHYTDLALFKQNVLINMGSQDAYDYQVFVIPTFGFMEGDVQYTVKDDQTIVVDFTMDGAEYPGGMTFSKNTKYTLTLKPDPNSGIQYSPLAELTTEVID